MRIGIIIGRIGGIDGVALEAEKWITVLERLGHEIYIITGKLQNDRENVAILPDLDFHYPLAIREQTDAFYKQKVKEETFLKRWERQVNFIEKNVLTWIVKNKIDVLLSENASALPCHLAMGQAIKNIVQKTGIPTVSHDHDFAWERGDRYKTRFSSVKKIIKECFPLNLPNVKHAVINLHGQKTLKKKLGVDSIVVPNVMDFDQPYAEKDFYNESLPTSLRLRESDIPIFQITRIVARKGIENAIELVNELDDPNIKLVITGGGIDDYNANYYGDLVDLMDDLELQDSIKFADDIFTNERKVGKIMASSMSERELREIPHFRKRYSLSDAYAYARGCTYFSTYEGFGNAFVECVLAKKPIWVNNYKPVYWPDIGSKGFKTVMIENGKLTKKAVADIKEVIYNQDIARDIAEYNYKLGKEHFSYDVLEVLLKDLFSGL